MGDKKRIDWSVLLQVYDICINFSLNKIRNKTYDESSGVQNISEIAYFFLL